MTSTKVEYTIKAEFAEQNKQNIQAVMDELRALGDTGVWYSSAVKEDGKSFVHVVVARDEAASAVLPELASFKKFQAELKENIEVAPDVERMTVIATSFTN